MPEGTVASGRVFLVGAGPGDPDLLTLKGRDCLQMADVVLYDYLVPPEILSWAPAGAECLYVGKTCNCHHLPQKQINDLLLTKARAGLNVVRLKGGDPFMFARGGEEALALAQAGIAFEVVPGISAAIAAAACSGIPLTHRDYNSSLALVSGHTAGNSRDLDYKALLQGCGCLAIYMGLARLKSLVAQLQAAGCPQDMPVAVVSQACWAQQQTVQACLASVEAAVAEAALASPAIIFVGRGVELGRQLPGREQRSLHGWRVWVTRTAEQAPAMVRLLRQAGAQAEVQPLIDVVPPRDYRPLDTALQQVAGYHYLLLTSANAVAAVFARLEQLGLDSRALAGPQILVVGRKTAATLADYGIVADKIPEDFRAEGLWELLSRQPLEGKRVLYPRAAEVRDFLPRKLQGAGAQLHDPLAYETRAADLPGHRVQELLEGRTAVDAVTFTSGSTVRHLWAALTPEQRQLLAGKTLVSIGPVTSEVLRGYGLKPTVEAAEYTLEGMVAALGSYAQEH